MMAELGQIVGHGYLWTRGDPLPPLDPLPGFRAGPTSDVGLLATLAGLSVAEVERRVAAGNQPYLAWVDGTEAAYGWSGAGDLPTTGPRANMRFPPGTRWLWDFVTLPEWRGRGIYPRLLQEILTLDTEATRFFIGHRVDNVASRQGILKAGFRLLTNTVLTPGGERLIVSAADGQPFRLDPD
jgi:GNAT superfamily N-acetyltransferase